MTAHVQKKDEPKVSPGRAALLAETAVQVGALWALALRDAMKTDGRSVEGGWPGTVREARTRVAAHFYHELPRLGMSQLRGDELVTATQHAYGAAKRKWLGWAREGYGHPR